MPVLLGCKETAEMINRVLPQVKGLGYVRANHLTGRVVAVFDEGRISVKEITYLLESCGQWESGSKEAASAVEIKTDELIDKVKTVGKPQIMPPFANMPSTQSKNYHQMELAELYRILNTVEAFGLTDAEATARLQTYGPNLLYESKTPGLLARIAGQMKDFLVQVLLGSSVVCAIMGEFYDALAILTILGLNAFLGALQEYKADGALAALKQLTAPTAKVFRDGQVCEINATELVPGDIVTLEQGDSIPADVRIISASGLEVEESALTGETYPVSKQEGIIKECLPLVDCNNLAFMGTSVSRGRATAIVVATGMQTEIGKIAEMLQGVETEPTPLQERLAQVGKSVLKVSVAASGLLVLVGILRGGSMFEMFMTGVSLAVAAIPEGLPAVVTLALAAGVGKMAKSNAVVRRLPAVETLGCATVICTDKTGTLTKNEQTVQVIYCPDQWWRFTGRGYDPTDGMVIDDGKSLADKYALSRTLTAAVLCSNAELIREQEHGRDFWTVRGDPTEGAIMVASCKAGLSLPVLQNDFVRLNETPFDAERRCMTVICRDKTGGELVFVKGAPDTILKECDWIMVNNPAYTERISALSNRIPSVFPDYNEYNLLPLDEKARHKILAVNEELTQRSMRVLGVAYRSYDHNEKDCTERGYVFLGLIGMLDPPRKEVRQAIASCRSAGIKVVMITGDHCNTALAVAKELALFDVKQETSETKNVLTGYELDRMSDEELDLIVSQIRVFARVLPKHKLRLVKAFRRLGEVVAMIGDGVNDAPAVKEADIGIAMGKTGTDVTKQSAEIIITDDNFATVVTAVGQGRSIYENIRRSVRYLLATNAGEVILMFGNVLLGMPLAMIPIQLLWLNLLGDGLPALALAVDPPDPQLMLRPPRAKDSSIFDGGMKGKILSRGLAIGLTGMGIFSWGLRGNDLFRAQTMTLAMLTGSQLLHAMDCRHDRQVEGEKSLYVKNCMNDSSNLVGKNNLLPNKQLQGAVVVSAALLFGAVHLPFAQRTLKTCSLGINDWLTVGLGVGLTSGLDRVIYRFLPKNKQKEGKTLMLPSSDDFVQTSIV